jgi:hypothetical protein
MDEVDFDNLNARLKNNTVLEKQTKFWLDYLFARSEAARQSHPQKVGDLEKVNE